MMIRADWFTKMRVACAMHMTPRPQASSASLILRSNTLTSSAGILHQSRVADDKVLDLYRGASLQRKGAIAPVAMASSHGPHMTYSGFATDGNATVHAGNNYNSMTAEFHEEGKADAHERLPLHLHPASTELRRDFARP
jgi:hypothetical protein